MLTFQIAVFEYKTGKTLKRETSQVQLVTKATQHIGTVQIYHFTYQTGGDNLGDMKWDRAMIGCAGVRMNYKTKKFTILFKTK